MSHVNQGSVGVLKGTRMMRIHQEFVENKGLMHRLMTMVGGTIVMGFQRSKLLYKGSNNKLMSRIDQEVFMHQKTQ